MMDSVKGDNSMKTFRIYCGLNTQGMTGQAIQSQSARKVEKLALKHFPQGHTIIEAKGRWMGERYACTENTLIVEVIAETSEKVYEFAGAYKEAAMQESVMITETEINASFV